MITEVAFEHECKIRDLFIKRFGAPSARHAGMPGVLQGEEIVQKEAPFILSSRRADLLTMLPPTTSGGLTSLRVWEFKIVATAAAIGQTLLYLSHLRLEKAFAVRVRGVIAAFEFESDLERCLEVMNLGLDCVVLPQWMAAAGKVPVYGPTASQPVDIPMELP